jgi:rare lipoprotein A
VPVTLLPVARLEPAQAAASAPTTHVAAVATEPAPSAPPQRVEDAPRAAAAALAEPKHRAYTKHAQGFWVQIGAFRERSGAEAFQRRVATEVDWLAPLLAIFNETAVHRLQAGPYASREEAGSASQRIRQALQLMPVIVERR